MKCPIFAYVVAFIYLNEFGDVQHKYVPFFRYVSL